jgi:membrane-bound serine protease (ClpP class)
VLSGRQPANLLVGFVGACLGVAFFVGAATANPTDAPTAPTVDVLVVDGAIDPITAQYVSRGIDQATRDGAGAVLIELNTPGGLDSAMRQMTGAMLRSTVPVIVYVTPAGARAGSAGVFVLMAADVAAMAPETNVGAAHPVDLGSGGGSNLPNDERDKVTNDAAAYIRMLATTRRHDAAWAEEAVRQSVSLTADEARQQDVVNFVSPDQTALLADVDGFAVVRAGQQVRLQTRGAAIVPIDMTLAEQLLHLIDDPNVAYLLLSIGGWALLAELFHPGSVLPGVVGVLCLALALTALQSLPLNWTGLALILGSLAVFVVDLKAPSHGALTAAGLATFIVGSLMLFAPGPNLSASAFGDPFALAVSPSLIALMGIGLAAFFGVAVRAGLRARHRPTLAVSPIVAGAPGFAITDVAPLGTVRVAGEEWNAQTDGESIHKGDAVRVITREGLRLVVRRSR